MSWIYRQPVEIVFGAGTLETLPKYIERYNNPLIISSPFFRRSGLIHKLLDMIGGDFFDEVSPNPDVSEVNKCSAKARTNKSDLIIAIGGGSVIDLAKAASIVVEDISEYHGTGKIVPLEHLPVIAIPTTSGTGSEVTNVSVLSNHALGKKAPIASYSFYPILAIIDPLLTYSLPKQITASSGIDVLCHAIEGYWSKAHQPICDTMAIHSARLVFKYLAVACEEPDNSEARAKMSEASLMAGLAFSLPKTTSSHACSYPLTSIYNIPHGEACGLTLDFFTRVNAADPRVNTLAEELEFSSVEGMAEGIQELKQRIGLSTNLSDFNLTKENIAELVKQSHHSNLLNNPIEITDEILYSLYNHLAKEF